ncbi:MAG: 8-amino-7-oxononanoate synthase [Candidatus Omnitrophica bacterium]|nr:8-amino-7-oxononanoate synthase [Candidatus Omnitrophota bacterium]
MNSTAATSSSWQRLLADCDEELTILEDQALRRRLMVVDAIQGVCLHMEDREMINWCSNDYLGLSAHPVLFQAATEAAAEWGLGARASRLLSGSTRWHEILEQGLARHFNAEAAIVFPSGYQANLGALSTLLGPKDIVFVDRLSHASLLDAARATQAAFRVFRHNDADHLAHLLKSSTRFRRRLIVTEGLFSMDGDQPPLLELIRLSEDHQALVFLDDAHGAFVLGSQGRGTPEYQGVSHSSLIYMATLGKALGCQGGFVVGPESLIELLRNRARTFLYTTALAIPLAAAAAAALEMIQGPCELRVRLAQRVQQLHLRLQALGFHTGAKDHIVPLVLGSPRRALSAAKALWQQGIWAPAIRPPTVPKGSARLRLSLTALHTSEQIEALASSLQRVLSDAP